MIEARLSNMGVPHKPEERDHSPEGSPQSYKIPRTIISVPHNSEERVISTEGDSPYKIPKNNMGVLFNPEEKVISPDRAPPSFKIPKNNMGFSHKPEENGISLEGPTSPFKIPKNNISAEERMSSPEAAPPSKMPRMEPPRRKETDDYSLNFSNGIRQEVKTIPIIKDKYLNRDLNENGFQHSGIKEKSKEERKDRHKEESREERKERHRKERKERHKEGSRDDRTDGHKEKSKEERKEKPKDERKDGLKEERKERNKEESSEERKERHKEERRKEERKEKHREERKERHKEDSREDRKERHKDESREERKERHKDESKEERKERHKEESREERKERHKEESREERKERHKEESREERKERHKEESKEGRKEETKENIYGDHKEKSNGKRVLKYCASSDESDTEDGKKVDKNDRKVERMNTGEDEHEESSSDSEDNYRAESPLFYKSPMKAFLPTEQIIGPTPKELEDVIEPMTFYPTYDEFKNLKKYIKYMEECGAVKGGMAKIVPPKEWVARREGYNPGDIDLTIESPVQQNISVTDVDGAFKTISDRSIPPITPEEYARLATSDKYITPPHNSYAELESLYWKQNLDDKLPAPIYGADCCDSLTDKDQKVWNIKRLDSLLTDVMEEQIPGVNLPYLYFGMWKATFSWHVEDMDLYAVNFLHYGAPKTWYCVPPQYAYKLEQIAQQLFPDMAKPCFNMMRHKAVMISPSLLRANGVKVNKMVQEERNIMVVFPHAYHSGFNHGFNMAESTNFAISRWVEYGKRFRDCVCRGQDDQVSINMNPFVKEIQPDRYQMWKHGKDYALHPEDPWYVRRCLQDGVERLNREDITIEEFEKLKRELKRMRKVPNWFKERFTLDYDDQLEYIDLPEDGMDMTDCIELKSGPRMRAAKRNLIERLENVKTTCDIKIKKLRKTTTNIYLLEMKAYEDMKAEIDRAQAEKKARIAEAKDFTALGGGAARGVGFSGAVVDDLLEKKSRVTCKAKKNHRFKACSKCSGCRRANCGECMYCMDMPKFGGMGVIKQKCETRVCVNPIMTTCDQCVWDI